MQADSSAEQVKFSYLRWFIWLSHFSTEGTFSKIIIIWVTFLSSRMILKFCFIFRFLNSFFEYFKEHSEDYSRKECRKVNLPEFHDFGQTFVNFPSIVIFV